MDRLVVNNKTINLIKLLFKLKPEIYSWQICINCFYYFAYPEKCHSLFFQKLNQVLWVYVHQVRLKQLSFY